MDHQAYNSPTYTYINHTLISTITLTPQPLTTTIYLLPFTFTFYLLPLPLGCNTQLHLFSLSTQAIQATQAKFISVIALKL